MNARPTPSTEDDSFARVLVEEADCFDDWRDAAAAAAEAYRRWTEAPSDLRADRYRAYTVALELEESAAVLYAVAVARVARRLEGDTR